MNQGNFVRLIDLKNKISRTIFKFNVKDKEDNYVLFEIGFSSEPKYKYYLRKIKSRIIKISNYVVLTRLFSLFHVYNFFLFMIFYTAILVYIIFVNSINFTYIKVNFLGDNRFDFILDKYYLYIIPLSFLTLFIFYFVMFILNYNKKTVIYLNILFIYISPFLVIFLFYLYNYLNLLN